MPANTHIAPISTDPISAVHITRSVSTAELVSTVSHAGQNASGNVLATPIASESLSVTAATTTAATKEDSPMQSSKASSKTGNRKRARATSEQVTVLESVFMVNRSPASRVREDLAARLGMAPRQVQVWFQNRRAKEKTQQRNPRGLQHHPSILLDQLAYANGPQDFYSMAMASTIGASSGTWLASALKSTPEAMHIDYGAAGSTGATTALTLLHAANIADSRRESEASGITAVASPGGPGSATLAFGSASATASNIASPTATPISGSAAAVIKASVLADQNGSHRSQGPLDSRYTSSASLVPPVSPTASPVRPAPKLSHGSTSTSTSSENVQRDHGSDFACSPNTTAPVSANNGTLGSRCDAAGRRPAPLTLVRQQNTAGSNGLASGGNGRPLQGDMGFGGINTGMAMALSGRLALGYSPFIPEIPSYMLLDATRLSVGSWIRVPMDDTELTCHACVAPPPLKPVMRPGNHRPAELDSLIGEFQWIISSAGQRYKMVLSYSAISRIKFRELPDTAASLVDVSSDSVSNPQAALSLLSCALKNPQAKGELSIHIYDLPTYYLQTANGSWKEIGDFSENLSASNTGVHTISGSFATLFYKLRILLATCSRLKIAADPLMSLWLGNMDDPYSAFSAIPHNAWTPCAEAVCLHSAKRGNHQAPDHEGGGNDKACLTPGMFSGVTTGDLPPALSTSGILPVFGAGMP
ncbi:Short stature homeobox protein 2, partial [Coemansia sp. RSA 2049]